MTMAEDPIITKNNDRKKRVMSVDDEFDVISVLKIVLEENGFQVVSIRRFYMCIKVVIKQD